MSNVTDKCHFWQFTNKREINLLFAIFRYIFLQPCQLICNQHIMQHFLIPILNLKQKIVGVILELFAIFYGKRGQNCSRYQKLSFVKLLRILLGTQHMVSLLYFLKKVKIISSYRGFIHFQSKNILYFWITGSGSFIEVQKLSVLWISGSCNSPVFIELGSPWLITA